MTQAVPNSETQPYSLRWIGGIQNVDRYAWDLLALPLPIPFLEWEWLYQLEASDSIAPETGWAPNHLTVWRDGRLVAAAALYVKANSRGEFVFDRIWSDVAGQIGLPYYPKLVGMSPVTPVSGYRFLMAEDVDESYVTRLMLAEIERFCRRYGISGSHFLYVDPQWRKRIEANGYSTWRHQSFSWENQDYGSFEDYLSIFKSNQRRNIKRERRALAANGIELIACSGDEIPADFYARMYGYYARTNDQFGPFGCKFLKPAFFERLADGFAHRLLFVAAREASGGPPAAMALLLKKGNQLYGRYWGARRTIDALHFNVCYYYPIEWSIRQGIAHFDPGIGGAHKVRRGFRAVSNFSLHRFYHPRLREIMRAHIDEINRLEMEQIELINRHRPIAHH